MDDTSTTSTTTTDRPGSMSAALASVEAPSASSPETTATPTETAPAAATVQPEAAAIEQAPVDPDPQKGAPPQWRWQDILENARRTSAEEAKAAALKEYQWAQQIDPSEREGLLTLRRAFAGDPQAIAHIRSNPQAVTLLKGLIAEQQAAASDAEPEPDLQAPDGTLVYSAAQQAKREAWLRSQYDARLEQRLQPFERVAQTFQQREQLAAYTTTASSVIAKMEAADPAFKAHKKDIAEAIATDERLSRLAYGDPTRGIEPDLEAAMELAWARVHRTKVLPVQQKQSEAEWATNLKTRAVAAVTNPSTASTATPKRPTSMREALAQQG